MTVYEYECKKCGAIFDLRRHVSERDEDAACPKCGGNGRRILQSPSLIGLPTRGASVEKDHA